MFNGRYISRQCPSPGLIVRGNSIPGRIPRARRRLGDHDTNPTEAFLTPGSPSVTSHDGSNYHAIQAKSVIQIDLHNPYYINRERQSLLKSALQLVNRIAASEPDHNAAAMEEEPRLQDSALTLPEAPSHELLFMLLSGISICL